MPVYVDPAIHWWRGKRWCHMFADSLGELHEFAKLIDMKREWFQDDWRLPHYDITELRRAMAVKVGAVSVDLRFTAARMRQNVKNSDSKSARAAQDVVVSSPEKVVVFGLRVSAKVRKVTRPVVHHQDKASAKPGNDQRQRPTQKGGVLP